jgi:hypothetical protein
MLTTAGFAFSAMSAKFGSAMAWLELGTAGAAVVGAAGVCAGFSWLFEPQGSQSAAKAAWPTLRIAMYARIGIAMYAMIGSLGLFKSSSPRLGVSNRSDVSSSKDIRQPALCRVSLRIESE